MTDFDTKRLVFIGGLHRSGTTLLARLLGKHPHASGFFDTGATMDEGQNLQDVYPGDHEFGGPGLFAFAAGAHLTEDSPLAEPEPRDRLLGQWAKHWDLSRDVLVEKSPSNIVKARYLRAIAPDSRFVFIMRHPVVVALATQRWSTVSLPIMIEHWFRAHRIMFDDLSRLDRWMVLKYEALVADPQAALDRVCALAGLDPAPAAEPVRAHVNRRYEALLKRGGKAAWLHAEPANWLTHARQQQWRKLRRALRRRGYSLDHLPVEARYLGELFGDRIAAAGYSLDDFDAFERPVIAAGGAQAPPSF
jgi:hypothetical protein